MIEVSVVAIFIIAHFISDYVSDRYYSSEGLHSVIYGLVFFCCSIPFLTMDIAFHFAIFSAVLHYSVDYIINIVTNHIDKKYSEILCSIDHAIHLIITFYIYSVIV